MKITDVKVHLVRTRRETEIPSPWIFVQVCTDEGLGSGLVMKEVEKYRFEG